MGERFNRFRRAAERLRAGFDSLGGPSAAGATAADLGHARDAVDLASLAVPGGVPAWQRAEAVALLAELWQVGQAHGVAPDRWATQVDLPTACLAALADRR